MIIARQFIAWNASGRDPSRRERSEGFVLGTSVNVRARKNHESGRSKKRLRNARPNHTVPYERDPYGKLSRQ